MGERKAASSAAERQRRFRDRQKRRVAVVPVEVSDTLVEHLLDIGALDEDSASDPRRIGQAISNAVRNALLLEREPGE